MRDADIRFQLADQLQTLFAGDVIRHEMGLCLGATRVDIAVVNGALHGYEIKSDVDSLSRLPRQIELYDSVLDFSTIVCGPRHFEKIAGMVPAHWGIQVAGSQQPSRAASRNTAVDPFAVAQLLWRDEAAAALARSGARVKRRATRWELWDLLAQWPLRELQAVVRTHLKERPKLKVA